MSTIQVNAHISQEDLLSAIAQLGPADLDGFVSRVIRLRAHRKAPHVSHQETELFARINQGLAPDVQTRYDTLIAKRQAECLTPEEYQELLALTQQVEQFEVQRIAALSELAQLRQVSLSRLIEELQIPSARYV